LDEFCDRLKIEASSEQEKKNKLKNIFRGLPPGRLKIPSNLFFTGTVNIDETTYLFSPKVLDRANVIEFMKVDLIKKVGPEALGLQTDEIFHGVFKQRFLSFTEEDYKKWRDEHWHEIVEERLAVIHGILEKSSLHFGYRTREEILQFLYCSRDTLELKDALDFQIKQRILPKIKGPATIRDTILELKDKLSEWGYSRSLEKLNEMVEKLEQGFTSYF
jgi:5-methylcytosine-specific restriction endonuclease McrBC GTP-binding regulatory subunit McrB